MARWLRKRMEKQEKFNNQLKETAQSANEALPEVAKLVGNVSAFTKTESPLTKKYKNPCWKKYKMVGTKIKNGKRVPNCVPKKKKKK